MATSTVPFPLLKADNFSTWKYRIRLVLNKEGALVALDKTDTEIAALTGADLTSLQAKDVKAQCIIAQSISDKYIEYIESAQSAKEMIANLENVFQRKSALSKMFIMRKLLKMKFVDGELQDHFTKFEKLIKELDGVSKVATDDTDKTCYLLLTMPESFESVITSIETIMNKDATVYSYSDVKTRLLDTELKNKENSNEGDKVDKDGNCSFYSPGESKISSQMRYENVICHTCRGKGHFKNECPSNKDVQTQQTPYRGHRYRGKRGRGNSRGRGRGKTTRHMSNVAQSENDQEEEFDFISAENIEKNNALSSELLGNTRSVKFILDSGATNHWVSENLEKLMENVEEIENKMEIKIANGSTIKGTKRGIIRLKVLNNKNNSYVFIKIPAIIVPEFPYNLLSVKRMSSKGFDVQFNSGGKSVTISNNKLQMKCESEGNLYVAQFSIAHPSMSETCCISLSKDLLWHRRLGHLNAQGLGSLNFPHNFGVCSPCNQGKAKRKPFKDVPLPRSNRIGELIHSDLAGPFKIHTMKGEKYYQTIIDDYSHFTQVFLLKHKNEAERNIMNYVQELKARGYYSSRIRSDCGGEYSSHVFKNFCIQKGIVNEYTLPHTQQQNGVSERINFTLMSRVRTLFAETNLPKFLWGEAIRCAAYQLNRSPTVALKENKVPAEVYLGKVNYDKMKVFGSKAWAYKLPVPEDKLETRSVECIMVGYAKNGYRLWVPKTSEIIISRDVTFDEININYTSQKALEDIPQMVIGGDSVGEKEPQSMSEGDIQVQNVTGTSPAHRDGSLSDTVQQGDQTSLRRSERIKTVPEKFKDYILYKDYNERFSQNEDEMHLAYCLCAGVPITYEDAICTRDGWEEAIQKEISALEKHQTWEATNLPKGIKAIDTMWLFKVKPDGTKKARLVAKGFQEEVSSNIYAPVAQLSTIRILLSVALQNGWEIKQLDIPTAFLNGKLDTEVYIKPPKGVKCPTNALKLMKSLYGLRSSPRKWNERFNEAVQTHGLIRSQNDFCLYLGKNAYLIIWVDDIIITGEKSECLKIIEFLKKEFNAKELGIINNFLGTEINVNKEQITISQKEFIQKVISRFGLENGKPMNTPMEHNFQVDLSLPVDKNLPYRELLGSLIYISIVSRPDIAYATSVLSRYLDKPTKQLWIAAKRVLRYLNGTKHLNLTFHKNQDTGLITYSDADWAGDITSRKSTSGCIIYHCNNPVSWFTKKQTCVSQSTAEAEYIACAMAAMDVVYFQRILVDLKCNVLIPLIYVDNQSALNMCESYENSRRTRHIDIKYHYIKDLIHKKLIELEYIKTQDNVADIFTKSLNNIKFAKFFEKLNIK